MTQVSFSLEHADKMPQFTIDVLRASDGVGNFRPQKIPESLAQPMNSHLYIPFAKVEVSGNLRVRGGVLVAPNETFQFIEKPGLILDAEFLTQSGQYLLD